MAIIRVIAIAAGLACMTVDFYATVAGRKNSLHRTAHLLAGLVFMGLVYVIWPMK